MAHKVRIVGTETYAVESPTGQDVGTIWHTPYGWFASPRNSEIQAIPAESARDAFDTVVKHGTFHPGQTPQLP